jgi:hypothetical protein
MVNRTLATLTLPGSTGRALTRSRYVPRPSTFPAGLLPVMPKA